ncbi:MAG: TonB-dependent siderophore receptor [Asticcacaulis sp.]
MIRNRKHASHPYLTAALMAAAAVPALAGAAAAQDKALQGVTVTAEEDTYKADVVSSPKQTQALVNTPQTIQVIRKEVIQEQQATTLMEALRNTPGITMQLGEQGNSTAGDAFQMRGFDTSTALLVDGMRDKSIATRDTFNIEQIEVVKGPGGADSGRGSTSGYINVSTKQASLDDAASASVGAYSQGGARATVDVNRAIGETSALRLNLMTQDIDTAGRDLVNRSGYGAAVAYGIGLETNTRFHLSGQYLNFDNTPDGGIPTVGMDGYHSTNSDATISNALNGAPAVRRENFYGARSDFEKQEQGSVTAKFEHDFAAGIYFTNLARWSNSSLERVQTGVSNPVPTVATASNPASWTNSRSRQRVNNKTTSFNNISNFTTNFNTGVIAHDLAFGFEYSDEKHSSGTFSTVGTTTAANTYKPNPDDTMASLVLASWSENRTKTASIYALDTLKFGEKWLLTLGLRSDSYRLTVRGFNFTGQTSEAKASKSIFAYKAGLVYKPVENGSLYVSYATTQTPPGHTGTLSTSGTNINNPNVDPTETENLEVGAKWDFFEGRLGLSGAWYKTNHTNWVVGDTDGDGINENYGDREIKGFEFGLVGKITDKWSITAGIQTMEDENIEGGSVGATSRWSPELSGSFWSTYQLSDKLKVGGGARYMGEQIRQTTVGADFATTIMPVIPEYWVVDGYAAYGLTEKASLQLNLYNIFDEDYVATLNNNGARATLGAPRTAALTLNYRF